MNRGGQEGRGNRGRGDGGRRGQGDGVDGGRRGQGDGGRRGQGDGGRRGLGDGGRRGQGDGGRRGQGDGWRRGQGDGGRRGRGDGWRRGQGDGGRRGRGQSDRAFPIVHRDNRPLSEPILDPYPKKLSTGSSDSVVPFRELPKRNGIGREGREIVLDVNHFRMEIKIKTIFHYDVTFKPDVPKKLLRRAVTEMNQLEPFSGTVLAFDGVKNIYTAKPLAIDIHKQHTCDVTVAGDDGEREKSFSISVQSAGQVDVESAFSDFVRGNVSRSPRDAVQGLDIALRHMCAYKFVPVARSFFGAQRGVVVDLGGGASMWHGHFQSLGIGWKPFLNFDIAHKAFPTEGPVLHRLLDFCWDSKNVQSLTPKSDVFKQYGKFTSYIKGLKVVYQCSGRKRVYRVNGLTSLCASDLRFESNNRPMSVTEYFKMDLQYDLKYPNLPCLHVGDVKKKIYIPMELCAIKGGQTVMRKTDANQTAKMIRETAKPAHERKQKILNAMKEVQYNADEVCKEFGISVSDEMECLRGRVLPSPKLAYGSGKSVPPMKGVWNMRDCNFFKGERLEKWVVLNLSGVGQEELRRKVVDQLIAGGRNAGMVVNTPMRCDSLRGIRDLEDKMKKYRDEGIQLVLVILDDRNSSSYTVLKRTAEVGVGVLTQCMLAKTARNFRPDVASNILLKINSKLGGTNNILDRSSRPQLFEKGPVIVFGADVTHPAPDQKDRKPSVAAVCASLDPNASQYMIDIQVQPGGREVISNLQSIVRNMLHQFYIRNGQQQPQRILFFRDGVGEGQFEQILREEVQAIRNACTSLHEDYQPPITFLVVQKRHHTRFFPTSQNDEVGRGCNVPPGTIVDHTITHPNELDFYLVSHQGIQGTSRPTRYHVLWDDSNLSTDDVETLCYFLCYTFVRCTRSVSYPAPTYYAHLAAFRGRTYLDGRENISLEEAEKLISIKKELTKATPMHFV